MKKVLAIVLAMMLVLSASAAFAAEYEIVSKGFQHQYWQAVLKGAEKKAAELGVEINFVGPANESAYDEQLTQLNSAINAAPKAIGLAALSTETCLDAIGEAQKAGIPIIGGTSMTGGQGSIIGTLLGVFVMSLLKTGLPYVGLQANWQQIITGIVLIVAIYIDVLKNRKTA